MKFNFLKNIYFLYPLYEKIEYINMLNDRKKDKILIYQMGKVGSSTVYNTVKHMDTVYATYHLHWFSDPGIKKAEDYFKNLSSKKIPMHIQRSKMLKKLTDIKKDKIKVISITREPVGRLISDVFQNIHYYNPELVKMNDLHTKELFEETQKQLDNFDINSEYGTTWFDVELSKAFNINLYDYPFNQDDGYTIIKHENIEILLLQMETMNKVLKKALQEFLDYEQDIEILNTNIGEEKEFANEQSYVKENIDLDEKHLNKIYSSKYVQHFYSAKQIKSFVKKWKK